MREIKFRAWNKVGKFYVNDVQDAYDGTGPDDPFDYFGAALDDNNYVVEQFTGLYDENGREIYEGDISSDGWRIEWRPGGFWYVISGRQQAQEYVLLPSAEGLFEIVGNIHENPELVKK